MIEEGYRNDDIMTLNRTLYGLKDVAGISHDLLKCFAKAGLPEL